MELIIKNNIKDNYEDSYFFMWCCSFIDWM